MYLSKVKIENFRKFEYFELDLNKDLNVLVGENDSGKTCFIDAIKIALGTHTQDKTIIEDEDFHVKNGTSPDEISITCHFSEIADEEAAIFLELLEWEKDKDTQQYAYKLSIIYTAYYRTGKRKSELKAGNGNAVSSEQREYLNVLYLKPLRDAESELTSKRYSRLSQILLSHSLFKDKNEHYFIDVFTEANTKIKDYFTDKPIEAPENGKEIKEQVDKILEKFLVRGFEKDVSFDVAKTPLRRTLEQLSLRLFQAKGAKLDAEQIDYSIPVGLGSNNLLFIAAELLFLHIANENSAEYPLKLALIEEIEAHLHPQAQLRVIQHILDETKTNDKNRQDKKKCPKDKDCENEENCQNNKTHQFIISTHSNTLTSKVPLKNLILFRNGHAFPMGPEYTYLYESKNEKEERDGKDDYKFLQRFLDDTKANLFFANAVLIVEGTSENLLLPVLAEVLGLHLHRYGVSIVNVGCAELMRYAKIFHRKLPKGKEADEIKVNEKLNIKVACITDRDFLQNTKEEAKVSILEERVKGTACSSDIDKKKAEL